MLHKLGGILCINFRQALSWIIIMIIYPESTTYVQINQATTKYICPLECNDIQYVTASSGYTQYSGAMDGKYYTFNTKCRGIKSTLTCEDPSCWIECGSCPAGQYASTPCTLNLEQICSPCFIPPSTYLSPLVQDCSDRSKWTDCSPCTPPKEYQDENGIPFLNSCPEQVYFSFSFLA
jgi:hypothetical protein